LSDKFILMDLERTLKTGRCFYWNTGRRGYTNIIETAGRYSAEEAKQIEAEDLDETTLLLKEKQIEKIIGQLKR
jgi:hypothetical protein